MKRSTVILVSGLLATAASMAWFLLALLSAIMVEKFEVMPSTAQDWMRNIQGILSFVRWSLFCVAFLFLGFDKQNSVAALMGGISSVFLVVLNVVCKFLTMGNWASLLLNWWFCVLVGAFLLAVVMLKNSVPLAVRITAIVSSAFMIISEFVFACANVYQCMNGATKGVCRFYDTYNMVVTWPSVACAVTRRF